MIKTIIRLENDMVMVFDAEGEQIPEYQGQYDEVNSSILRNAPAEALFTRWLSHDAEPETISREGW